MPPMGVVVFIDRDTSMWPPPEIEHCPFCCGVEGVHVRPALIRWVFVSGFR